METIDGYEARPLRYKERLARKIVAPYIDSVLLALPERGHEPMPDFEMVHDGERIGWLEVTTGTDQASRTLYGQLEERGHKLTTHRLRYDWFLLLKSAFDFRAYDRERLVDALVIRELTMSPYPTGWMDPNSHPESDAILDGYHVARAGPTNSASGDEAVVRFNPSGQMHWVDANTINRLAEERFDAKRSQLDGRKGERHLFVWVDIWERSGAGVAMYGFGDDDDYLPGEAPVFPEWVSDVWLLHTVGQPRLWHCSRVTRAWETYDVDRAVLNVENA